MQAAEAGAASRLRLTAETVRLANSLLTDAVRIALLSCIDLWPELCVALAALAATLAPPLRESFGQRVESRLRANLEAGDAQGATLASLVDALGDDMDGLLPKAFRQLVYDARDNGLLQVAARKRKREWQAGCAGRAVGPPSCGALTPAPLLQRRGRSGRGRGRRQPGAAGAGSARGRGGAGGGATR